MSNRTSNGIVSKQMAVDISIPTEMVLPCPTIMVWFNFKAIEHGCPNCGSKRLQLEMHRLGELVDLRGAQVVVEGEDLIFICRDCYTYVTFRFRTNGQIKSYTSFIDDFFMELLTFFSSTSSRGVPDYQGFNLYTRALLKSADKEDLFKGSALKKRILNLAHNLLKTQTKILRDEKGTKDTNHPNFEALQQTLQKLKLLISFYKEVTPKEIAQQHLEACAGGLN